nr:unnamed protein product [Digitaria exilis]
MPSISPADLLVCSGRCSTKRDLRLLHAALIRRRHILPTADAVAVLAKLLRFAAVSPAGDLRHASALLSLHLPFISAAASHLAFFYNTLIRGFAASCSPIAGIKLFAAMRRAGGAPDAFTFTFVLKSCSRCHSQGRLPSDLHAQAFKHGCLGARSSHAHVHNALMHAYASRAAVEEAQRVFDEMPVRDVVSFSGLLTAHLKGNHLDSARIVFDQMPLRDVVSWTAIISAYARARRPQEALALFDAMPMQPDEVTMSSEVTGTGTFSDATVTVEGDDFIAENVIFKNSAPQVSGQATAVCVTANRCVITGNGEAAYMYLGRPWEAFGRVVFAETFMGHCIKPAGWHNWDKPENKQTACFYEYSLLLV